MEPASSMATRRNQPLIFSARTGCGLALKMWIATDLCWSERYPALLVGEEPIGRVQAYTFGYERDLTAGTSAVKVGLGAQVTAYGLTPQMKTVYGDRPAAFSMFLRIRPSGNAAIHMQIMHQH